MGTENELAISQSSDVAASDSDYDTDLETEGKLKLKLIIKIFLRDGWGSFITIFFFGLTEALSLNSRWIIKFCLLVNE